MINLFIPHLNEVEYDSYKTYLSILAIFGEAEDIQRVNLAYTPVILLTLDIPCTFDSQFLLLTGF